MARLQRLIANIEELQNDQPESSWAQEVLSCLKHGYLCQLRHLKRLQIEAEVKNRNSSACGDAKQFKEQNNGERDRKTFEDKSEHRRDADPHRASETTSERKGNQQSQQLSLW